MYRRDGIAGIIQLRPVRFEYIYGRQIPTADAGKFRNFPKFPGFSGNFARCEIAPGVQDFPGRILGPRGNRGNRHF